MKYKTDVGNKADVSCDQQAHVIDDFNTQKGVSNPQEYYIHGRIKIPIFEINTFHLLTQFIGYAKFANRNFGNVYLRGQTSLYPQKEVDSAGKKNYVANLTPSCFRSHCANTSTRITNLNKVVKDILSEHKTLSQKTERDILFPLLQHYGVKTYWLDIVDNIWIALWFSLHNFNSAIVDERQLIHVIKTNSDYSYIILLASDAYRKRKVAGIYYGDRTVLNDLRKSTPSFYLRPHAQHALMLRKSAVLECTDYSDLIVGIAKIPVNVIWGWIGHSGLLSAQSIFPSPFYDTGYKDLLTYVKKIKPEAINTFGSIQYITSDYLG